jgi:hypothetical protein
MIVPGSVLAARVDNPRLKIDPADQAWAQQTLLRLDDFGLGWHGGIIKSDRPQGPTCPGFDPKASDLVVTGHANASFTNPSARVQVSLDSQVMQTADAVRADFDRTIQPPLPACLAYQLKQGPRIASVTVVQIPFPKIAPVSAAYRATITVRTNAGTAKVLSDFVFLGDGRVEFSLNVVAPSVFHQQLVPFEADMARMLVKRTKQGE